MADKTVVVRIVVRANQFSSGLKKVAADTNQMAVDVERASSKAGSSALALGAASATAGKLLIVGIGGAMAVSAKAAIDFESSLAGVAKTTDLTGSAFARNGSPLAAFGEALRSLSQRIPINVNELAQIAEIGGQLGVETPNLIEFTEVMAALGVSTNLSAEQAASGLARFSKIMGVAQDDFGRLGSVIVDLGNNLPTTESEILTFATRLAPVGKTVGIVEQDVLGLSAAMTSLGIPAERGATALQRLFLDMQTAVLGGGEALDKWAAATRMTSESFAQLFRESPTDAFLELIKQLDATQESGGNAAGVLESLGVIQQRSIQVLLASANGWEEVADAIDIAGTASDESTALFEEAARRYGTSASQMKILSNAFTDLRIEIGNALLGSGGLAAGIDFLREFVRIIKDNLPLVGRLATALGIVAGIRIGAGLLSGMVEAVSRLKSMRLAAEGTSRATAAMRLSMLGVNTAVFAAIAIAGVLITKWAAAAVKAAELRRKARELREELENSPDPIAVLIGDLRDSEILTGDAMDLLNELGLSVEDFVRRVTAGDVSFEDLLSDKATANFIKFGDAVGMSYDEVLGLGDSVEETRGKVFSFMDLIEASKPILDAVFIDRAAEIRNGLIEAGKGAAFATDELDRMSMVAARNFDLDVPVEDIIRFLATDYPDAALRAEQVNRDIASSTDDVRLSWQEMVMAGEGGEERIEDFFDMMVDSTVDFKDALQESFSEVRNIIMDAFPTWDEYEQQTIESLDGVIEAQDAYLEDLRDGFDLQEEIAGSASGKVISFIENLDPATKGALARFRETNREEFDAWLIELDSNLGEAGFLVEEAWQRVIPGKMEQGFNNMLGVALKHAQDFGLAGEEIVDVIADGIETQLRNLPEEHKDDYLAFVSKAFENDEFWRSIGLDIGDPIVQGLLSELRQMAEKAGPVLDNEKRKMVKKATNVWGIESPSKVTAKIGKQITAGFFSGMETEFDKRLQTSSMPIVNVTSTAPNITVQSSGGSGSSDINIYYPEHKSDDIVDGVHKAAVLKGIQVDAETTVGFG